MVLAFSFSSECFLFFLNKQKKKNPPFLLLVFFLTRLSLFPFPLDRCIFFLLLLDAPFGLNYAFNVYEQSCTPCIYIYKRSVCK